MESHPVHPAILIGGASVTVLTVGVMLAFPFTVPVVAAAGTVVAAIAATATLLVSRWPFSSRSHPRGEGDRSETVS